VPTKSDIIVSFGVQEGEVGFNFLHKLIKITNQILLKCAAYSFERGSTFLRVVVDVFAELAHELSVTQLLDEVANRIIVKTALMDIVESPMYSSLSMRKSFFLFPEELL
jgi:hypothetical protein